MTTEPYTCRDRECREKEAQGKRCPWCLGGYPILTNYNAQFQMLKRNQTRAFYGSK